VRVHSSPHGAAALWSVCSGGAGADQCWRSARFYTIRQSRLTSGDRRSCRICTSVSSSSEEASARSMADAQPIARMASHSCGRHASSEPLLQRVSRQAVFARQWVVCDGADDARHASKINVGKVSSTCTTTDADPTGACCSSI
jgi:hypothetical protein